MSKQLFLGLCGLKGAGKDTVGDMLVRDFSSCKDSFAAPLKDAVSVIFGWDRSLLEGATKESREWRETVDEYWAETLSWPGFTPRIALMYEGTQAGRNVFGEGLWTGSLGRRVRDRAKAGMGTAVTDVRFPNEIETVLKFGGTVVEIRRGPKHEHYLPALEYNKKNQWTVNYETLPAILDVRKGGVHESEWRWIGHPGIGRIITNDGDLTALADSLRYLVDTL